MLPADPLGFRAWLESLAPTALVVDAASGVHPSLNDPLCAYLRWRGAPHPLVGCGTYRLNREASPLPMPDWAARFTVAWDRSHASAFADETPIRATAAECLDLLAAVLA